LIHVVKEIRCRYRREKLASCARACVLCIGLLFVSSAAASAAQPQKYLIEFGWDEPSTAFLRTHLAQMEEMPFDGCVFHVDHLLAKGEPIRFTWEAWGKRAFTLAELEPALADLKTLTPRRFTHNFLRFNVTPGDLDWFDDFAPVLNNARLAAQLARAGHAQGILFDVEPYIAPVFDFHKQRGAASKTWPQYQAQVRKRGQEVMNAFQAEYAGLTVFLTFGYSIAWAQMHGGTKPLPDCQYGLLPAFLDGMLDAARGQTRLVDGCELAYSYRDVRLFQRQYDTMKTGLLSIVADSKTYQSMMSLGFGLWLDRDWRKRAWNAEDFSKNYYTPAQLQASLRQALEVADQYVWLYSETPRWWTDSGPPTNLPPAYIEAVRQSKAAFTHE
jgi:hypothetical protein